MNLLSELTDHWLAARTILLTDFALKTILLSTRNRDSDSVWFVVSRGKLTLFERSVKKCVSKIFNHFVL